MHIISVQTLAGGTGVTTVTTEIAGEWHEGDATILALDLGHNQMLGDMLNCLDFELIGDASELFWSASGKKLKARQGCALPKMSLMNLGEDWDTYRRCSENALLGENGHRSLQDAQDHFARQLDGLAPFFDVCIVDLSKAPRHLKQMFVEISNEIRFCERQTYENSTWEAFHLEYLMNGKHKPGQTWMKYADRGDKGPIPI